eukprot:scaffold4059_cov174-Ochromonas_danica.AAC.1
MTPTLHPTHAITGMPSFAPSVDFSSAPSLSPTNDISDMPSFAPSVDFSSVPSLSPSFDITDYPTVAPSSDLTALPTASPSYKPSLSPSNFPSIRPSRTPSAHPSRSPTSFRSPTQSPTRQTQPILSFASSFVLSGMSATNLSPIDQKALLTAQADSLSIDVSYISYVGTSNVNSLMDRLEVLDSYTISVTTKTTLPMIDFPQYDGNVDALYGDITTALALSVGDGSFTSSLQAFANSLGSTALASASVTSVENFSPTVDDPPSQDADNSDNSLSEGAISGIVIGSVVFTALVGLAAYYFYFKCKATTRDEEGKETLPNRGDIFTCV